MILRIRLSLSLKWQHFNQTLNCAQRTLWQEKSTIQDKKLVKMQASISEMGHMKTLWSCYCFMLSWWLQIFSSLLLQKKHTLPSSLCIHENLVLRTPSYSLIKCIGQLKFSFYCKELTETACWKESVLGKKTLLHNLNQPMVSE